MVAVEHIEPSVPVQENIVILLDIKLKKCQSVFTIMSETPSPSRADIIKTLLKCGHPILPSIASPTCFSVRFSGRFRTAGVTTAGLLVRDLFTGDLNLEGVGVVMMACPSIILSVN